MLLGDRPYLNHAVIIITQRPGRGGSACKGRRLYTPPSHDAANSDPETTEVDTLSPTPLFQGNGNANFDVIGASLAPIFHSVEGVTLYLHDEGLWREFAKYGTEMIINRGGRYVGGIIEAQLPLKYIFTIALKLLKLQSYNSQRVAFKYNIDIS